MPRQVQPFTATKEVRVLKREVVDVHADALNGHKSLNHVELLAGELRSTRNFT